MNKILKMFAAGTLFLAGTALWALGSRIVWSAERILMAAVSLALVGFLISL